MKKKEKIICESRPSLGDYIVIKTINTLYKEPGDSLSTREIQDIINNYPIEVELRLNN